MMKRKLEELNLLDDFLFGTMVSYPKIGEAFVRELLRIIFGKEFGKLIVVPQKVYYGNDTNKHGARLDVYLEEAVTEEALENATVFDMEPDQNNSAENREALPKRTRFYHAKIDSECLEAGEGYQNLKNVVVIMIMPYDPFGMDHMIYTVRNRCEELPEMPYDDGARTLYLYTKGRKGNPTRELRQLLEYMEHTNEENARNESLLSIQRMVTKVKQDREVSLEFMKIFEREEMLIEQGRKEERINTEKALQQAEEEKRRADHWETEYKKLQEQLIQAKENQC